MTLPRWSCMRCRSGYYAVYQSLAARMRTSISSATSDSLPPVILPTPFAVCLLVTVQPSAGVEGGPDVDRSRDALRCHLSTTQAR